jgi:hypothetical protein
MHPVARPTAPAEFDHLIRSSDWLPALGAATNCAGIARPMQGGRCIGPPRELLMLTVD